MRAMNSRRAFTLIEILIVVGIIALLLSITLVVGKKVVDNGRKHTTEDILRTLDLTYQAYASGPKVDGRIPATVVLEGKAWPMSDVRDMTHRVAPGTAGVKLPGNQMMNSVGLFIALVQASDNEGAKAELGHLPARFTGRVDLDGGAAGDGTQPELMTAFDAWGNPIRFVHPALDGIIKTAGWTDPELKDILLPSAASGWGFDRVRRSMSLDTTVQGGVASNATDAQLLADSDAGMCEGATGYFYSAGPDGFVGKGPSEDYDKDNTYTRLPKIPAARKTE